MSTPKGPFDPPAPEPVSALEVVGGVALTIGVVAANEATGGLLSLLVDAPALLVGALARHDEPPSAECVVIADTAAPIAGERGNAPCNMECTRCGELVTYESMSLNEDGYFCSWCAAALGSGSGR